MNLGLERFVQQLVDHAHTPVGPFGVVVTNPGLRNVVKLIFTEANGVVKTFPLERLDERLRERVDVESLQRYSDTSGSLGFPECPEFAGILAVAIIN